jgi:3alpha(or 20beta)-hydroxysteroid dehydrogenase
MGRVQDKIALVTGGARGMGAAHARLLVSNGAKGVIGDVLNPEGEALAGELGASATHIHLDVTQPDDWAKDIAHTLRMFGGLNVLVNNAGIAGRAPTTEFPLDLWRKTLDINLTGLFLGIQRLGLVFCCGVRAG